MNSEKSMFIGKPYSNSFCQFTKKQEIGSGSYSDVRLSELEGVIYAVKKIKVNESFPLKYLLRETEALIKLKGCDNVVKYYQIWFSCEQDINLQFSPEEYVLDGDDLIVFEHRLTPVVIYIVMEYCEGTLQRLLQRGEINNEKKERYFRQILNGLNVLDTNDLVHRDLHPSNIFIDSNDCVKIGDFGLALQKDSDLVSTYTDSRGYKLFRPPENINSNEIRVENITGIVDVYYFGLNYYFMCLQRKIDLNELDSITDFIREHGLCYKAEDKLTIRDRDRLARMLTIDPEKRITIKELHDYVFNDTFEKLFTSNLINDDQSQNLLHKELQLEGHENKQLYSSSIYELVTSGTFDHVYKAIIKEDSTAPHITSVTLRKCLSPKDTKMLEIDHSELKLLENAKIMRYKNMQMLRFKDASLANEFSNNSCYFFVMEPFTRTLSGLINERKFAKVERDTKCRIIREIAEGLIFLHKREILHLNLNPDNIFITQNWSPKIGNFMLNNYEKVVKFNWFHFENNDINYVDALMVNSNNEMIHDKKADIYSLGLIFTAFWHDNQKDTIETVESLQYGLWGTTKEVWENAINEDRKTEIDKIEKCMSKSLRFLIQRMINIVPNKRLSTDQLEEYLTRKL